MSAKLPSERTVLRKILAMYESAYPGSRPGENDPYLPIKVEDVAEKLGCSPQLLFGYLYYYLDHKYRYKTDENTYTHLFALKVGARMHCVNYPYLAGILAAQNLDHTRSQRAFWISLLALTVAAAGLIAKFIPSNAP